jgi:excisionase family DNA binding protein
MPETIIEQLRRRKGYVRTTEAMSLLGGPDKPVARQTLCKWVKAGKLPAVHFGGGFKFDPAVLADYLEARTTGMKPRKEDKAA